jgi:hypothetical protein
MKNKKFIFTLLAIVLMTFVIGCHGCLDYYHYHPVTEERDVSEFRSVTLNGVGNVNIRLVPLTTTPDTEPTQIDDYYRVTVTADVDVIDKISTTVKDGVFFIDGPRGNSSRGWGGIDIDIYMPDLKLFDITLNGVGHVRIKSESAYSAHYSAHSLNILLAGVGDIDAMNYRVNNVTATLSGVGDIGLWATDTLYATLTGVGDIRYRGNPQIFINNKSTGSLRRQ